MRVVSGTAVGDQPIRGSLVTSMPSSSARALNRALCQRPCLEVSLIFRTSARACAASCNMVPGTPTPTGPLRAPLSATLTGTECVWHGQRHTHHSMVIVPGTIGVNAGNYKSESVSEHGSMECFELRCGEGTIGVDPTAMWPEGADRVMRRSQPRAHSGSIGSESTGFTEEDFVLREGSRAFRGAVTTLSQPLVS